ncbi:hypothetical protein GBF35_25770 [Nonomuraea phyllanthi]|uniref:hypothetical protein n=1 Tax=Nonomuraea phyllanthi TaxID=2219224 RepID=UPI00129401A7|nr:hypothetical protein [Nonomuraea phyllanthi]QFY09608.1 hypothetical protein GBF35_25770 [Nonomuraea phyllanthi]
MIPTYGIDFDGVIHRYGKGWFDGTIYDEPMPGAFDGLHLLMQHGAVFIHTSRDPLQVGLWLGERGGFSWTATVGNDKFWTTKGLLLITSRKYPAKAYLDDRAVKFTSWELALAELLPPEPRPAAADAATASGPGAGLVTVPVEDLRTIMQLARCPADGFFTAEDLAVIERLHAHLRSATPGKGGVR